MKTKTIFFTALLLILLQGIVNAQLIVTNPAFPADNDLVEITFNAALGNGGLAGYSGDVYAHTGVITNLSTGPSDWKYVKTNWGQNTEATKLVRIATDLYKLTINPDIRQYYNVPAAQQILQMAFVFRSGVQVGGSWLEGKTESGGDIFVDVYPDGLFVRFEIPSVNELLVLPGELIQVQASANSADSLFLYENQILIKSVAGNQITETLSATLPGRQNVKVLAKNESETAIDSFYYYVRQPVTSLAQPTDIIDGINYIDDTSVILSLYAPGKEFAFVLGDFNDWLLTDEGYMYRTPDGNHFWLQIDNLVPGQEYIFQYFVDGSIRIGDPYAEKVSDPWNDQYISQATYPGILPYPTGKTTGVATVLQTAQTDYQWEVENFTPPAKTDMVVYELLIRDFLASHNYQTLIDTLSYLKSLGVNTIELMPVSEFEGNLSWGYNPNFYFAPDKYYGPADDFKKFIDECHKNGIAVVMDMVLNHSFGTSPMVQLYWDAANNRPAENNPWFNPIPKHDYNVGFDFNHESPATKQLVSRVVKFWIEKYKIDGYRFDLSKGFTQKNTLGNVGAWGQYDATRIAIWKAIADTIWSVDPDSYVILEHFADNSEEKVLSAYGMMLWGNVTGSYANAARGASTDNNFSWASYKARGWTEPHLISYMESHDEERMMYRILKEGNITNPAYRTRDTTIALERVQLASVFYYTIPGPKMIWQFGELGYDYNIDYNGRTGEKPIRWDYTQDYRRRTLRNVVSSLINLKLTHDAFRTTDFTLTLNGYLKRINLNHPSMNVVVLGNFDVNQGNIVPGFNQTGKWYEYFTGDSVTVANLTDPISLQAGEYRLYTNKRLTKPETGIGIEETTSIANALLSRAYPNPSSSKFTFDVNILQPVTTTINIYDINGKLVKGIFSGNLQPGIHHLEWNGEGKKPGVYMLRLTTDQETQSTRLILK
jgi:glycosidase